MLHPVQTCIAEGQRDTLINNLLTDGFGEHTWASKAAYVLRKIIVHEAKAQTGKVNMRLNLVDSEARVAASPDVEEEVADRGVLKSNRLEGVFQDVDHGMQVTQGIKYFVILKTEQRA
jgi:hypothetical protein